MAPLHSFSRFFDLRRYPYALAIASAVLALAFRLLLDPWLGYQSPYPVFLIAVAVTALYASARASLITAALGAIAANYFFVPPRHQLGFGKTADLVALLIYIAAALAILLLVRARHTAWTRAESAYAQAEGLRKKLQAVVDAAPAAVITFGTDRTVTSWNAAAERIFGWRADEIIGKPLPVPPSAQKVWESTRQALLSGRTTSNLQTKRVRKDGKEIDVLLSDSPVIGDRGEVKSFVGVIIDASELVAARQKLEQVLAELTRSEELFRSVFEQTTGGIAQTDLTGRFVLVNDRYCEIVGRSREELLKLRMQDITHPEDLVNNVAQFKSLVEEHGPNFVIEKRYLRPDGSIVWVRNQVSAIRNAAGELVSVAAACVDMTETKWAEAALRQSEQQFIQLAESIPQLAWMADEKGWIFWYNRRWFEYTGTTLEEMQGWGWRKLHHPDHVDRVVNHIQHCWETGEAWQDTFPLRGRDGSYRWFLSRALPIRDEQGRLVRWFGTNTDITELRNAEEALRRAEALAATGRMAHAMAHEINNPLEAVTNLLYLLEHDSSLSDTCREWVVLAATELARVSRITKETLGLYSGAKRPEQTSVCTLADGVIDTLSQVISAKQVRIERRYEWNGTLELLPNEIQKALWNLLENAIEAVPVAGKVVIRIYAAREHRTARGGIRITIADNGAGIKPEHKEKLFEPFASTKDQKGAGLGLWVVRDIVSRHGGAIRIRSTSRPGPSGTCCSIFLPSESTGANTSIGCRITTDPERQAGEAA